MASETCVGLKCIEIQYHEPDVADVICHLPSACSLTASLLLCLGGAAVGDVRALVAGSALSLGALAELLDGCPCLGGVSSLHNVYIVYTTYTMPVTQGSLLLNCMCRPLYTDHR